MKQDPKHKKAKVRLFSGLGRTLAVSFLVFALTPMVLISVLSYNNAHQSLKNEIRKGLKNAAGEKTREISSYFDNMLAQLKFQSETEASAKLLEELVDAYEASGKPLAEFVKSVKWALIVDKLGGDIKKYRKSFNYYDVLLIGINGDILFSAAEEADLGNNIFTDVYESNKFAAACKRTIETGKRSFSDYERYTPSGGHVFGFIIASVVNQQGDRIGAMAFQFGIDHTNRIMKAGLTLGKTAETYLVGMDLALRSGLLLNKERVLFGKKILTDQTKLLKQDHDGNAANKGMDEEVLIYQGPNNKAVLGIHYPIEIENIRFAVIAEIEEKEAFAAILEMLRVKIFLVGFTGLVVVVFVVIIVGRIVKPVIELSSGTKRVEEGDYSQLPEIKSRNEIGNLGRSFNTMIASLKKNLEENRLKEWFQAGQMELSIIMRGNQDLAGLSRNIIAFLAKYLNVETGAIYIVNTDKRLKLTGSYAFSRRKHFSNEFDFGQGLVGQAALEKDRILLTRVPEDYMAIRSGLGETTPRAILVKPFMREDTVMGVIELGALDYFSEKSLEFVDRIEENIAASVQTIISHLKVEELLEHSQAQSEELQAQQEELRQSNEELEEQTSALKESEAGLQAQKEELQQTNEELEEQTQLLEEQKVNIKQKNIELEKSRSLIEEKAKDLEISGKYKSEFLANMSHELRTPLNSILLLSKLLSDNKDHNLTEKQEEFARTIQGAGFDLLKLINEILDLSKVESGKMELHLEDVYLQNIADTMKLNFKTVALENKLYLNIDVAQGLPNQIRTDRQRLDQVIKNLLSNAFKFTSKGSVTLKIGRPENGIDLSKSGLDPEKTIVFSVSDTGIGIAKAKQKVIFEAFQQADGTTNRKYGGTGLGLSISRELTRFLGGELQLESKDGKGSTFTLYIPEMSEELHTIEGGTGDDGRKTQDEKLSTSKEGSGADREAQVSSPEYQVLGEKYIPDDRKDISSKDKSILIIEDDFKSAKILRDLSREKGFKTLVAENGETGLHFADYYRPCAVILDIGLPGMDGWGVMSRLKENQKTRHIPVHFISAFDRTHDAMKMGAIGYLTKPVSMKKLDQVYEKIGHMISKSVKKLLVVENDKAQRKAVAELIGSKDVLVTCVSTGREANNLLAKENFDCMILDLDLPDMSGVELLSTMKNKDALLYMPVIVYTGKELTKHEKKILNEYAESIIIKDTKFPERLLDGATLFLHSVEENLPEEKREMLRMIHDKEAILKDKQVLLVDDDMRNVFALTNILEDKGIKVFVGKNGKEGIEHLNENPGFDLVLMDIMMPEMDGYEAIEKIRKQERFKKLPIIALTAKAMKGDRAKCIETGASDYLPKPVDTDKLFSMLRVWLY